MPNGLPQDIRTGVAGLEQLRFDVTQAPLDRQRIEREFVRGGGLAGRQFLQQQTELQRQFQERQSQQNIQSALAQAAARGISPAVPLGQAITEQPITRAVTQAEQARVTAETAPGAFEERERLRLLQTEANRSLLDTQREFVRQSREIGRQVQKRTQQLDFKVADQLRTMQTQQRQRLTRFSNSVNEKLLGGKLVGSIAGGVLGAVAGGLLSLTGIGAAALPFLISGGITAGAGLGGAIGTGIGSQQAQAFLDRSRRF